MTAQPEPDGPDPVVATTDLLVKALRALGAAGHPVRASELAAKAWWALRDTHPREAEHVNGAMHYLARLPAESAATQPGSTPREEDA